MAALVPINRAVVSPPQPGGPVPRATPDPGPVAGGGPSFTAFPSSYGAFGNEVSGFGTVGVRNGSLTVLPGGPPASAPPDPPPAKNAGDPPPGDPPTGHAAEPPPPPIASLPPTSNDTPGVSSPPPIPVASLPPQKGPQTYGVSAPDLSGGSSVPDAFQQAQQAAQDAQAQADEAAQNAHDVRQQELDTSVEQVTFHIAAANGAGDTAAAEQLQPAAAAINGALQGQIWAGIGSTPPQPFAKPEVPPVFLNFNS
jgi:hypothetical protein